MWFEVAVVALLLLVGQVLFARFEPELTRWRILLRHAFGIVLFVSIAYFFGSFWFYISIAATLFYVLIIHAWWLPKHVVNSRSGEPKDRYYELRGWKMESEK